MTNAERIENAIEAKIKELRKEGTTGMSLENLYQITPTPKGLKDLAPSGYRRLFAELAPGVGNRLRFQIGAYGGSDSSHSRPGYSNFQGRTGSSMF
jgi:hypothetical protein